jgi:hypothetical protein
MRALSRLLVVALLAALQGCTTLKVRTDFDHGADFSGLRSFAWLEPPEYPGVNPFQDNTLLRKRVREAVSRELASKGFEEVPQEQADLLVTFHVTIDERTGHYSYPVGVDYAYGYGYRGYLVGVSYPGGHTESFQEGTLILDLIEPAEMQLRWRGWTTGSVPTRDRDRNRIELAVEKILDKFPPAN